MWVVGHKDHMIDNTLKVIACVQSTAPHLGQLSSWSDTQNWHIAVHVNSKPKFQVAFSATIRPAGEAADSLSSLTTGSNTSTHWAELESKLKQMNGPHELGPEDLWSPLMAGHSVFAVNNSNSASPHAEFYYYTKGSHYAYETLAGVRPLRLLNIGGATHSANVAANMSVVCLLLLAECVGLRRDGKKANSSNLKGVEVCLFSGLFEVVSDKDNKQKSTKLEVGEAVMVQGDLVREVNPHSKLAGDPTPNAGTAPNPNWPLPCPHRQAACCLHGWEGAGQCQQEKNTVCAHTAAGFSAWH